MVKYIYIYIAKDEISEAIFCVRGKEAAIHIYVCVCINTCNEFLQRRMIKSISRRR